MISSYTQEKVDQYIYKTLIDSAKNKNDLGSYNDCLYIDYDDLVEGEKNNSILGEVGYYLLEIIRGGASDSDFASQEGEYLLGMCLIKGCNYSEFENLTMEFDLQTEKSLDIKDTDKIKVLDVNKSNSIPQWGNFGYWLMLTPAICFVIHLLFTLFPRIPLYLFKCCFYKKSESLSVTNTMPYNNNSSAQLPSDSNNSSGDEFKHRYSVDNKLHGKFLNAFSFTANFDEFMNPGNKEANKYSYPGVEHIRGLRAFAMIFTTLGLTFFILYNSPLKIYSTVKMEELFGKWGFCIIAMGLRFSPKLMISYSGYLLVYKFHHYLDDILLKETHNQGTNNNSGRESINHNQTIDNIDQANNNTNNSNRRVQTEPREQNVSDIFNNSSSFLLGDASQSSSMGYNVLMKFIALRFHKYLIFVWNVCFFSYSFYFCVGWLNSSLSPMWTYFDSTYLNIFRETLHQTLLLYDVMANYKDWNPFSMAIVELLFFFITTIVLFFGFKKKIGLNWISMLLVFTVSMTLKLVFYVTLHLESKDAPKCSECKYHGVVYNSLFFFDDINGFIQFHPFFFLPSYLIGCFFGMLNYIQQKSLNDLTIKQSGIKYLGSFFKVHSFFKDRKKTCCFWISFIFLIVVFTATVMWFYIVNLFMPNTKHALENLAVNIIMLFDAEVYVFTVFMIFYMLSFYSSNFLISFFSHDYWGLISRTYYMFLLNVCPTIFFVFYQSESRIKIGVFNIVFFFLFIIILVSSSNMFLYIIQELPVKKLSKLLVERMFVNKGSESNNVQSFNNFRQSENLAEEEKENVDDLTLMERDDGIRNTLRPSRPSRPTNQV